MAENYEIAGWQRGVKVCSVIIIIIAILGIIGGLLVLIMGPVVGIVATDPNATAELDQQLMGTGVDASQGVAVASAILVVMGVILLVMSIVDLIVGLLGLRGAKDATKIGPFWVLSIIGLVISLISLVVSVFGAATGGGDVLVAMVSTLCTNGVNVLLTGFCTYFSTKIHGVLKYDMQQ